MRRPILLCLIAISAPVSAAADQSCFDAEVTARVIRQTPTDSADCGDDCIVMIWPWIVELDVRRVAQGELSRGRLIVQTLQHTYAQPNLRKRWWLRRNRLGTFNVLRLSEGAPPPPRCPTGTSPAMPYIQPRAGQTIDDLIREGEKAYGTETN